MRYYIKIRGQFLNNKERKWVKNIADAATVSSRNAVRYANMWRRFKPQLLLHFVPIPYTLPNILSIR